ncbi:hypothetical protein [Cyclobacterium qasimii]|uniref:Uncharacterized protein n=1 Tax=Cyclobacterium qasimii M12-11B TaxID=641524 RepID=S7VNC0_9BACT|nr:hypothetical protein [Cyclobacterium qasimii]EPR71685.1 hypothetical protein ADICYQ_0156 [Cyclobacterium qasimii M12-11B]
MSLGYVDWIDQIGTPYPVKEERAIFIGVLIPENNTLKGLLYANIVLLAS